MSKGGNRGQDQNDGKSPWAGSLRHVNPNAQKKKKQKKEDGKLFYISNHLFQNRKDFRRQPGFDTITFTFSENSNYWQESLLEVIRQNIAE